MSRMVRFLLSCALALSCLHAATPEEAAKEWVALVDAGQYAESWDKAAELFKGRVGREQWAKMAAGVKNPLGKVESRKLLGIQQTKSLPGAPDGEYAVIQFQTAFEKKKEAVETVIPMRDKDGEWRVSGYFIR
jgi:Protein of unknown function (DUF4019)